MLPWAKKTFKIVRENALRDQLQHCKSMIPQKVYIEWQNNVGDITLRFPISIEQEN